MKVLTLVLTTLASLNIWSAEVGIQGVEFVNSQGAEAKLSIKHKGTLNDNPKIEITDKKMSITISNSELVGKVNKKINGFSISGAMTGEETVALNINLPYSLKGKESDVTMVLKEGSFEVNFPRLEVAKKTTVITPSNISRSPSVIAEAAIDSLTKNNEAEKLDENYLSNLVKDQEKLANEKHPENKAPKEVQKEGHADTDRVTLTQSSTQKNSATSEDKAKSEGKSNFSISTYVGKFVAFLSLMILGFYGVLTLFKKGVIKKGKLGFLHSTKLVEVLSTTHIAPKRSLMMVKAHKQVFLISSSETGVQFISEIQDVAGLIKTGEEEITGSNFDTNLYTANKSEKQFKLKEVDQGEDYAMGSLDDMLNDEVPAKAQSANISNAAKAIEKAPVQDQVRLSDQIKTKIKNLKQLQ